MPQHADERHDRAQTTAARWAASAEKHRATEARAAEKGREKAAALARKQAERAEKFARARANEAERLELPANRAATARRLNEESAAEILAKAERAAAEIPHPVTLTPAQQRLQDRAQQKREQHQRQAEAARTRELKAADVHHDPRTAAGMREIEVRGPTINKRASLAGYAAMIARTTDRTPPRLLALERYDVLWHRAHAGLFPNPRFERGVDTSRSLPGVPDDRATSLQEISRLAARIGDEANALLFHKVVGGHSFAWMASQGMGEPERLGVLFLAAVDALARFYGIGQPSKAVEAMERRLEEAV